MVLFQLTLMPLVLVSLLLSRRPNEAGTRKLLENVVWGMCSFGGAIIPYIIFFIFVDKDYTHRGIFLYHGLKDYLYWGVMFLGGYFLLYDWTLWPQRQSLQELLPYALGFFLFSGVVDGVIFFGDLDVYSLFLMPLERLGIVFGSVYLVSAGRDRGMLVVPAVILGLSLFLLGGVGALLFYSGRPLWAAAFTAAITLLGVTPHLVQRIKESPLLAS